MTGLVLDVRAPRPGVNEATEVWVYVANDHKPAMPLACVPLPGVQADFLTTLVSEVTSTWAYGRDRRDVQRIVSAVRKQAREHAAAHEF